MNVDIVTPVRNLIDSAETPSVIIPSSRGELEVLPGHSHMLSTLSTGILSFTQGNKRRNFAVSYGFVEVKEDKVLVLAETCEESHEIDLERAKEAQSKAEEALSSTLDDSSYRKYQFKLQRALVRQQVAVR